MIRFLLSLVITLAPLGAHAMPDVPPTRGEREPASVNPSGVSGANVPTTDQGGRLAIEAQVVALYADAGKVITRQLSDAMKELAANPQRRSAQYRRNRASVLLRDLQRHLNRIDARAMTLVGPEVERAYRGGLSQAGKQASELGLGDDLPDGIGAEFNLVDENAVETVARDTVARMHNAANGQADRAAALFRSLGEASVRVSESEVNRTIGRGIVTGDALEANRELRRLFDNDPATEKTYRQLGSQIIQVGGWEGPLRTYASTVVRTRTREATVTARHNRLGEIGIDLVQINGRVSRNFCTRFIGLVVSLGEARDGYPSIRELPNGGPPFHPNCSKGTAAFVPELVSSGRVSDSRKALDAFRRAQRTGTLTTDLRNRS